MNRLGVRLMLTYSLVSLLGIGGVLLSANVLVQSSFRSLVSERIESEVEQYASLLGQNWSAQAGWDEEKLGGLGMEALSKGYIIRLATDSDATIWDARVHNEGLCVAMMEHITAMAQTTGNAGAFVERQVTVSFGEGNTARATFGLYGPVFFNESEGSFLAAMNQWAILVGSAALLISLIVGAAMARGIAKPLALVTETARQYRLGRWDSPLRPNTRVTEIADLWQSITTLGQNLKAQQVLRKRLGEDLSHELRTPLAIMLARLEALLDGVQQTSPAVLESLRLEVLRLTRLVDQQEKTTPRPQWLNSTTFLTGVVDKVHSEAQKLGLRIIAQIEVFQFEADPDMIQQILINLLSNALKYSPPGGEIRLSADRQAGYVEIKVIDSGNGIEPEDLPLIFERFYRADVSRDRTTGGQGLGLAIARSLAEAQGGELTVTSHRGQGSTFCLRIPAGE